MQGGGDHIEQKNTALTRISLHFFGGGGIMNRAFYVSKVRKGKNIIHKYEKVRIYFSWVPSTIRLRNPVLGDPPPCGTDAKHIGFGAVEFRSSKDLRAAIAEVRRN